MLTTFCLGSQLSVQFLVMTRNQPAPSLLSSQKKEPDCSLPSVKAASSQSSVYSRKKEVECSLLSVKVASYQSSVKSEEGTSLFTALCVASQLPGKYLVMTRNQPAPSLVSSHKKESPYF
jgi:hypothetical protein